MTRHLIVGTGPAALAALETIRALDATAEITLVGAEPPYARMVLPYFLKGAIEERAVLTGDEASFKSKGVKTHFGVHVTAVDPEGHRVTLDDGSSLEFDRLLLATGSRVSRPPIEGIEESGIVNMWTLEDATSFLAQPHAETVVVGAGFIAFTVLDALVARSEKVSFVELEPQILPHMLDAPSARLLQSHLEDRGIAIHTETRVDRISGEGGRKRLHFADGGSLDADAVVIATGVQPNIEFLEGSGIETGRAAGGGIRVDDNLRTNARDVYAAGDVAEALDLLTGEQRVHAIQPTAVDHGRVAGANMVGREVRYAGSLTMNILAVQELEACSFGLWQGDGHETTTVANEASHVVRKYVWSDDRLVGGILLGPTASVSGLNDVGMMKGLIQSGVALGPWRAYLESNPLDLRRAFVASGAARQLLDSTLLTGRVSTKDGFRFPALPARRKRSPHHATLLEGAPS